MNELAIKMAIKTTTSCQLVQNFLVCAVQTSRLHKLKSFGLVGRHSKLYRFAVETFKTLLFVQSRHSKLYCLCNRDIQNFIVCAVEIFKTLLFVQSRHSKLYCLCSRAIRNFLVCVSLLGLRTVAIKLFCIFFVYNFIFLLRLLSVVNFNKFCLVIVLYFIRLQFVNVHLLLALGFEWRYFFTDKTYFLPNYQFLLLESIFFSQNITFIWYT